MRAKPHIKYWDYNGIYHIDLICNECSAEAVPLSSEMSEIGAARAATQQLRGLAREIEAHIHEKHGLDL